MFQYINIPQTGSEAGVEQPNLGATVPSAVPPRSQQGAANHLQTLHYPLPAVAVSYVHPESHQCSYNKPEQHHFEHQGSNDLLHTTQLQPNAHQVEHLRGQAHPQTKMLSDLRSQSQNQPLSFPHPNARPPTMPLLPPPPPSYAHARTSGLSPLQWPLSPAPAGSHVLSQPTTHATPREAFPRGEHHVQSACHAFPFNPALLSPKGLGATQVRAECSGGKRKGDDACQKVTEAVEMPRRSTRKRQKRSFVWNFFDESDTDPNIAICRACTQSIPRGRNLARNTTNLKKHLEHRHPNIFNDQDLLSSYQPQRENPLPCNMASVSAGSSKHHRSADNHAVYSLIQNQADPAAFQSHQRDLSTTIFDRANFLDKSLCSASVNTDANGNSDPQPHGRAIVSKIRTNETGLLRGKRPSRKDSLPAPHQKAVRPELLCGSEQQVHSIVLPPAQSGQAFNAAIASTASGLGSCTVAERRHSGPEDTVVLHEPGIPADALEVGNGLVDFLAIMKLPLQASKSRGFQCLFTDAKVKVIFPSIERLRHSTIPEKMRGLKTRIEHRLVTAERVVVIVERREGSKHIICQYYGSKTLYQRVCLDVSPIDDALVSALSSDPPGDVPCSCFVTRSKRKQVARHVNIDEQMRQVEEVVSDWGIREKVLAVVLPERISWSTQPTDLLRRESKPGEENQATRSFVSKSIQGVQIPNGILGGAEENAAADEVRCGDQLPIASCLVATFESIFSRTICENVSVMRSLINPMSKGLFMAWGDADFLSLENRKFRSSLLKLPFVNLTIQAMLDAVRYFSEHLELIQKLVSNGGRSDVEDIVGVDNEALRNFEELIIAFMDSVQLIQNFKAANCIFQFEKMSVALPIMKQFAGRLEDTHGAVNGMMKFVVADTLGVVKKQWLFMESQSLYICSTLLDPRFKGHCYTSTEVADRAKSKVIRQCEDELRKRESRRQCVSGQSPSVLAGFGSNPLDHVVDSMILGRNPITSALTAYLTEPLLENDDNVDAYWRARHRRWPLLTKVAYNYALIPSTCETNEATSALGDYRNVKDVDASENPADDQFALSFVRDNLLFGGDYLNFSCSGGNY